MSKFGSSIDMHSMINISKKEDIVIPFVKIGDKGWEEKSKEIARSLLYSWGTSFDEIVFELKSDQELDEVEQRIETSLPDGLRLFFQTIGVANIKDRMQKFEMIGRLSEIWDSNVETQGIKLTDEELAIFPNLVAFNDHHCSGNLFCFHDDTKEIYYFDQKLKPHISKMFDSFDDYMLGRMISCQIDLFDLEVGQEKVEKWIEEIMIETFGDHIYKKWYF